MPKGRFKGKRNRRNLWPCVALKGQLGYHGMEKREIFPETEEFFMNIYLELFTAFFKIGLFTFGGGYAMLPMLEAEVVNKKHWATYEELMDYFAVGQCTPGVIAVNTATFIGYKKKKVPGALTATAGVICPSIVIILLIASLLTTFADQPIVQHALSGIRVAVCVLILQAVIKLFKAGVKNIWGVLIFIITLICSYLSLVPTVVLVIVSAAAGILIGTLKAKKEARHD